MTAAPVVVVGGGLAGLTIAQRLQQAGRTVLCLEASPVPGGVVRTDRMDGYLTEWGPQSFLDEEGSALRHLSGDLGILDRVRGPLPGAKIRYVVRRGRMRRMPSEVHRILSFGGFIRAMREPFVPARRPGRGEETVQAWTSRRFGPEVADRLFDALVTGIFAGDPNRLSVDAALPRLRNLERDAKSVVRGGLTGHFKAREPTTFEGGMGALPEALAASLGDGLRVGAPVVGLAARRGGYSVRIATSGGEAEERVDAAALVVATSARAASTLLADLDPRLGDLLGDIPYAPIASVALGFREDAFDPAPPVGFGALIPHGEGCRTLGCLFPATSFAGQAPEGRTILRAMVGGRRAPETAALPDDELVALIRRELSPLVGLKPSAAPEMLRIRRHLVGIPQYELGHADRLERVDERLGRLPGLFLAGNPYRGVAVGEVIEDGFQVAERIDAYLPKG